MTKNESRVKDTRIIKGQLHKFRNNDKLNLFNQTNFPDLGRRGKKDLSQQVNFELVNIS